jgi:hypothetical protein
MKRLKVGTPTKFKAVAIAAVALLALGSSAAANAVEDEWVAQSTRTLMAVYDEGQPHCYSGEDVRIGANDNLVAGEVITDTVVDGTPLTGDAENRVGPGVHNYTYVVTNLNSATDPKESVTKSGSFTVDVCPTPDPSATLSPITATANDDGTMRSIPVSGSVTLADIPQGATVTVVTTASSGATSTTSVSTSGPFSTTLTGSFPDGAVTVTSQTYVNGSAVGAASSTSVTFTAPPVEPQPEAPIVDAQMHGVLVDGKQPSVHAVVTIDRNDAEGPLTIIITHGTSEKPDATLEFIEDTETLRVTFPMDTCGVIDFSVRFADSQNEGQVQKVDVPCAPSDNGGGNDNGDGDTDGANNGNTGGTNNGTTNGSSNSNGAVKGSTDKVSSDTGKVAPPMAKTGDVVLDTTSPFGSMLMAGGVLMFALFAGMGVLGRRKPAKVSNH